MAGVITASKVGNPSTRSFGVAQDGPTRGQRTREEDACAVLADPRFNADANNDGFPHPPGSTTVGEDLHAYVGRTQPLPAVKGRPMGNPCPAQVIDHDTAIEVTGDSASDGHRRHSPGGDDEARGHTQRQALAATRPRAVRR